MPAKRSFSSATGKVHKSHSGVHTEFNRLAKDEAAINRPLRSFLKQAYAFKATADYEVGASISIDAEKAREAIVTAERFVATIKGLLKSRSLLSPDHVLLRWHNQRSER